MLPTTHATGVVTVTMPVIPIAFTSPAGNQLKTVPNPDVEITVPPNQPAIVVAPNQPTIPPKIVPLVLPATPPKSAFSFRGKF